MKHHLMVGTWTPPGAIFTFEFDDETLSLEMIKRTEINHDEPISWMTFDHQKKNIYGAAMKKWSSFSVKSPTEIIHEASHPMTHQPEASSPSTNTRAIFVLAAKLPPYCVYGNPFYNHAGYGNVFSTTPSGALSKNIQNYPYSPSTGIHGMVFDASETYLYSADLRANKIWTHRKAKDGALTLVGELDAPDTGDHPRWVELNGNYLYVLMEAGNRLAVYVIDEKTHCPVFTQITYPLIPPGIPNAKTMYRSDVTFLSPSRKYIYATTRSNSPLLTGYISVFALSPVGAITRQICMNPTPTSGGHSNAVSPCPWSDEWIALTDDEKGWLEIYRWKDEFLGRVAHLDVKEKGFGMNAIWYD
ncbi:probable carboxy-cis,cis-muconate cyclase [Rhynchosporium graminicola]|uniref:Probable carboxy-cis,cis-muconate cyclase n=1 Tax=Rhynchosporium graminicola TaxID=2792576 RepID=A0A1E1K4G9_9HELO|nr:probable carboxy-cis,cis-muconate cyclase [Rhynchosporium commune]